MAKGLKDDETVAAPGPTIFAHCDNSKNGALTVLEANVPADDIERRKNSRWAIMNVWRPLVRPVTREPRSWTLLLATRRILSAYCRCSRKRRTLRLARLIQVAKGMSCDFRCARHRHLQRIDLRHRKSLRTISIDGTTPRISDLTKPIYSSSSIRSPMAERGRHRILPSSRKMIMVLQERACESC
jgi:hypothetical protein